MIVAVLTLSSTAFFRRHRQVMIGVTLYTAILAIVVGWALTDGYPLIWKLAGTLVILAFTFSFSRTGSRAAITVGVTSVVTYGIVVVASGKLDPIDLVYAGFFLVAILVMGGTTSYLLERSSRRIFIQDRELAAERARSEELLLNTFPRSIVERLKAEPTGMADSNPEVSVLFADLVDFTSHASRLSPEAVVDVLGEVFGLMDELTSRHGLEKIKTVGDAYMAVAGAPDPRTDHVEAAAGLALAIVEAVPRFRWPGGEPTQVRVGLACGPVVSGVTGQQRYAYDLWGDTVNLASRLETSGVPGHVQVSVTAHDRLGPGWQFGEPRTLDLKGKGETTAWVLLARADAGSLSSGGPLAQSGRATDS